MHANGQSIFRFVPSGIEGQVEWPMYSQNSIYRNSFGRSHSPACNVGELCGLASKYSDWDGRVGDEQWGEELGQIGGLLFTPLAFECGWCVPIANLF